VGSKLRNVELNNLNYSPNIISVIKSRRTSWQMNNAYIIFVGTPEGKKSLAKPMRRWEGNIKLDHKRNRV
jgi:hypothetical protein